MTSDNVQLDAMRAGVLVGFLTTMRSEFVMIMASMAIVTVCYIMRTRMTRDLCFTSRRASPKNRFMFLVAFEMIFHEEPLIAASKKSCAWTDHIGCKGKLLAVEHKGVSIIIELVLHVGALVIKHISLSHVERKILHDGFKLSLARVDGVLKESSLSHKAFA